MQLEEKKHSQVGASSAERFFNCPGSVALCATVPRGGSSVYAATGTVAHALAEKWLRTGSRDDAVAVDEIGRTYVQDDFEIEITEEMVEAVTEYVHFIFDLRDQYHLSPADVQIEKGFCLDHIDKEAFGTCDVMIHAPMNRLIIVDYKHGRGYPVNVEDNKQLQYYALGAYYGLSEADRRDLAYIDFYVVQPRASHPEGSVRGRTISVRDLMGFESLLDRAIKRTREPNTPLSAGRHCQFCPAKAICPAIIEDIGRKAQLDFQSVTKEEVKLPAPDTLTPERLAQLLDNAARIKDWASAVMDFGYLTLMDGGQIPGYKLVESRGRRRWIDENEVIARYEDRFGSDLFTHKLKSPVQLEKMLKKDKGELKGLFETPLGKKALAPETDSREAITVESFPVHLG